MRNLVLSILLALPFLVNAQKQRVWIDTDILMGKFAQDVDDGLALMMALSDTNIQIVGVSLVGNVNYGEKVTRKLLARFAPERNIPLYKGAEDSTYLLRETAAVTAMTQALQEGPLTIMALGPMTNIGSLLEMHPELRHNVKQITFCGGRRPLQSFSIPGGSSKFSDYNFDHDPKAMGLVLKANVPVLLSGFDCSEQLFLSKQEFLHLKKSDHETDRWIYRQLRSWHSLWKTFLGSKKGFIPFDCATVGALLYPSEFELTPAIPAYIKIRENDTRNTVKTKTKPYLEVDANEAGRIVSYCDETKAEFKKRLLKVLGHPDYK
ncbi:MAG: nucleoside hydrolase [Flavobacteriales bacterium]|nr:nucleoside hydrolase [Flavobacteriales bacterium]MCB9204151.1 nucleoside hydrolase [Flavobacteriales bacterium]